MSASPGPADQTFLAAGKIVAILARAGIDSALIGAAALAAYGYPRSTEDLDLATGVEPRRLSEMASDLRREGFTVEVSEPDANDPLGGVLRVGAEGIDRIEIVNFCNPPSGGFPALVDVALREAIPYEEGTSLRVVTLLHLIVFKLYSGGRKSKNDVFELLSRNPDLDLDGLRELCRKFRMDRKLEGWLRELRESGDE
ncbi:MAG: hypothetical protein ACMG6S_30725, partial [Byssovorax sp.]